VLEELVGAEVLDVDIDQLAAAAIDRVAAHPLEVVRELPALEIPEGEGLAHVDGAPHRRVLAEVVPLRAHHLRARQDVEYLQSHQDRRRHVPGQSQPVAGFVGRRVHREISVQGVSDMGNGVPTCLSLIYGGFPKKKDARFEK
jgi:hypothetical protein